MCFGELYLQASQVQAGMLQRLAQHEAMLTVSCACCNWLISLDTWLVLAHMPKDREMTHRVSSIQGLRRRYKHLFTELRRDSA